MAGTLKLLRNERTFGLEAAGRMLLEALPPWAQELGLLVESVEANPPHGAEVDWLPGAVLRLPFSHKLCLDGYVSSHALLSLADAAMKLACAAAWDGYRPMTTVDQTMHFLRPSSFDVLADARILRVSRTATFARVTLLGASDKRPVGTASGTCSAL
jgi:acyl-coenzyme A thioesterase PaaI-like protein